MSSSPSSRAVTKTVVTVVIVVVAVVAVVLIIVAGIRSSRQAQGVDGALVNPVGEVGAGGALHDRNVHYIGTSTSTGTSAQESAAPPAEFVEYGELGGSGDGHGGYAAYGEYARLAIPDGPAHFATTHEAGAGGMARDAGGQARPRAAMYSAAAAPQPTTGAQRPWNDGHVSQAWPHGYGPDGGGASAHGDGDDFGTGLYGPVSGAYSFGAGPGAGEYLPSAGAYEQNTGAYGHGAGAYGRGAGPGTYVTPGEYGTQVGKFDPAYATPDAARGTQPQVYGAQQPVQHVGAGLGDKQHPGPADPGAIDRAWQAHQLQETLRQMQDPTADTQARAAHAAREEYEARATNAAREEYEAREAYAAQHVRAPHSDRLMNPHVYGAQGGQGHSGSQGGIEQDGTKRTPKTMGSRGGAGGVMRGRKKHAKRPSDPNSARSTTFLL